MLQRNNQCAAASGSSHVPSAPCFVSRSQPGTVATRHQQICSLCPKLPLTTAPRWTLCAAASGDAPAPKASRKGRTKKTPAPEDVGSEQPAAAAVSMPPSPAPEAAKRGGRTKKTPVPEDAAEAVARAASEPATEAAAPAKKTRARSKTATPAPPAAPAAEAAANTVSGPAEEPAAPVKKTRARSKTATPAPEAAPAVEAPPAPAPRAPSPRPTAPARGVPVSGRQQASGAPWGVTSDDEEDSTFGKGSRVTEADIDAGLEELGFARSPAGSDSLAAAGVMRGTEVSARAIAGSPPSPTSPSSAVPYGVVAGLDYDGYEKTALREALGHDLYELQVPGPAPELPEDLKLRYGTLREETRLRHIILKEYWERRLAHQRDVEDQAWAAHHASRQKAVNIYANTRRVAGLMTAFDDDDFKLQDLAPFHIAPWARAELVFKSEFEEFNNYLKDNAERISRTLPLEAEEEELDILDEALFLMRPDEDGPGGDQRGSQQMSEAELLDKYLEGTLPGASLSNLAVSYAKDIFEDGDYAPDEILEEVEVELEAAAGEEGAAAGEGVSGEEEAIIGEEGVAGDDEEVAA